jgi:hypothetical protein
MSLAAAVGASVIDDARRQTLNWTDEEGRLRQGTVPMVVFCRPVETVRRTGARQ